MIQTAVPYSYQQVQIRVKWTPLDDLLLESLESSPSPESRGAVWMRASHPLYPIYCLTGKNSIS